MKKIKDDKMKEKVELETDNIIQISDSEKETV